MTQLPEIDPLQVLDMEPEELAPIVLRVLQGRQNINRRNFTVDADHTLQQELGGKYERYLERLIETWMYLEREGFIAPKPGFNDDWSFVTSRGRRVVNDQDFSAYRKAALFPRDLDPVLTQTVKPLFLRGDYDTAVFRAFKEVEVRVRSRAKYKDEHFGIELMKRAFGPPGPLANLKITKPEQERMRDLFVGAIGVFKNPASHRDVSFKDVTEVVEAIGLADLLLRIVERSGENQT